MKVNIEKLPKSTLRINIVVLSSDVKAAYNALVEELVKNTELQGFRKGHAPKEMVLEKTDISKLYGEVVNKLLQTYYPRVLKEHLISPVSNPKVEIKEFDLEKDFEFNATVAVRPEVKVGDYKLSVKQAYNKKLESKKEEGQNTHTHLTVDEIISALLEVSEVEVADILKEEEADRMLARLIDQAQAIGMSLEQYLIAQNKKAEELRADYLRIAERTLKAEFILSNIIETEKITVDNEEIEAAVKASGDFEVSKRLQNETEKWYIKSVLAKNKLISQLALEAEGENAHVHK